MAGHPGTRPHVGAPPRYLDVAELTARRAELLSHPPSEQRSIALARIRRQFQRIGRRSERRGA